MYDQQIGDQIFMYASRGEIFPTSSRLILLIVTVFVVALLASFQGPLSALSGNSQSRQQGGALPLPAGLPTYRVTDFGVSPNDGKDDFDGMQRAADAVCRTGGTLVYAPGVYQVNRIKIIGGPSKNNSLDIQYRHCNNVLISGRGALIRTNGNFSRTADYTAGTFPRSYKNGVTPFRIEDSTNFTVEGFELQGGVDQMTRDPGVAESSNAGLATYHCSHFTLRDLNIHHFHTDGVYIGGSKLQDEDIVIDHLSSHNNARLAMAIIQARNVLVRDSSFSSTGRTGSYGFHAPGSGVDVEPNLQTVPPTENIRFVHCVFRDNLAGSFTAGHPDKTGNLILTDSEFSSPDDSISVNVFAVTDPAEITNNRFTVPAGHRVILTYASVATTIVYTGNTFNLARTDGILSDRNLGYNIVFSRNRINVASIHGLLLLHNLGIVQGNVITISGGLNDSSLPVQNLVSFDGTKTVGQNDIKLTAIAK